MVYFASDFHLGNPDYETSRKREKLIVNWLDSIKHNATEIFLLGDIFEFWFEWKHVVPKYFVRFLGKLAELTDKGINVNFFAGNHDLWAKDYLAKEIGLKVYLKPQIFTLSGKNFYIFHGDGFSPKEKKYRFVKKFVFLNPFVQFVFGRILHPDLAFKIAMLFSDTSNKTPDFNFENFPIFENAKQLFLQNNLDFIVMGHFHTAKTLNINNLGKLVILGDWLTHFTYAQFDGEKIVLKKYNPQ